MKLKIPIKCFHKFIMPNQVQIRSIPGIDLSISMKNCLSPYNLLEEPDIHWDWDIVFNQVMSEISLK